VNITTTPNVPQGRLYAGHLPEGATIKGTVTRTLANGAHDTGALVELAHGRLVQLNAGVIRRLPPEV
jgi:hypothetical protein